VLQQEIGDRGDQAFLVGTGNQQDGGRVHDKLVVVLLLRPFA
jgi:hypothetical protein